MPATTKSKAIEVSEEIRLNMSTNVFSPVKGAITISIGVSEYMHGENLKVLLARADRALYISKNAGRNRVSSI